MSDRFTVPGYFISGTGTGVGKSVVTAALARSLLAEGVRVGVYKPVLSGWMQDIRDEPHTWTAPLDDDVLLWQAAGSPGELARVAPQRFRAPLAPPIAARVEGKRVDAQLLRTGLDYWRKRSDIVLVEGAGGLFSPISDDELNVDLARDLELPVLLVAPNILGVIHSALTTKLAAERRGPVHLAAIILNDLPGSADASRETNHRELQRWCEPTPVVRYPGGDFPLPLLPAT